jgi:hypothetical protein
MIGQGSPIFQKYLGIFRRTRTPKHLYNTSRTIVCQRYLAKCAIEYFRVFPKRFRRTYTSQVLQFPKNKRGIFRRTRIPQTFV